MSENKVVYSIQQTYIITPVITSEKGILTCEQRIDIPTIEPLPYVIPIYSDGPDDSTLTIIPCIELVCEFLGDLNLTLETNEGVTVLPIKIPPGQDSPVENLYSHFRYVLVLPRGTTGVKSCKLIYKFTDKEVQHNFTFGIMPPPYNYDNALFGYCIPAAVRIAQNTNEMLSRLYIIPNSVGFERKKLPKGVGKQTIHIAADMVFLSAFFNYPLSSEPTIHKPKITLHSYYSDFVCTLSLNKTTNTVLIDLFTGVITAYDSANGEIIQQFMFNCDAPETISFENFDDIDTPSLTVDPKGVSVRHV